jgi:glutamate-1-semialdehyde 2,1-aminomutase
MKTAISHQFFEEAKQYIPGGVNSPVRAFKSVGGDPLFITEAQGATWKDADGNQYIEYIGSWGPMILGHAYPKVVEAVKQAAEKSTSFGAPTYAEVELARLMTRMVPGLERVRMVNSGTEAAMSAIRMARAATGRSKIVKFEGNYHGHYDAFLIKAGSGAATLGAPSSPGVTEGVTRDTLLARYNDLDSVRQQVEAHGDDIAAIAVEPIAGNMGCVPPQPGFLEGLRSICDDIGAVLLFDEVMCGFRVAPGGAQERFGVQADMICMGKIIGGGLPVGAYGGKEHLMRHVSPEGKVYQAGTLSGNPLAMAAGYALLSELYENPAHYDSVEAKSAQLERGFQQAFDQAGLPAQINRVGSMMSFHFTDRPVIDFDSAAGVDLERFRRFFHAMLKRGIFLPPSAFESMFVSDAHTEAQIEQTLEAARASAHEIMAEATA